MSDHLDPELDQDQRDLIEHEEAILDSVITSLTSQLKNSNNRYRLENSRARELTSELVQSSRDEDKAMLASDEAVSHALKDSHGENITRIEQQISKPYFARVIVTEDRNGKPVEIEYKLGTFANPDCRIVDWRRAPIARLYYEYREGDEYSEVIQGQEREGHVKLRHMLEIQKSRLIKITSSAGTFIKQDGQWTETRSKRIRGGNQNESEFRLKDILSLITPEQFDLITREAKTAILIQGIAGSGKTTVALHRLAWLLHEDNSPLKSDHALVVVHSQVLQNYISQTLPGMGISGVSVMTYSGWIEKVLQIAGYDSSLLQPEKMAHCSASISRLKSSFAFLNVLEELSLNSSTSNMSYWELLVEICRNPKSILEKDSSRLLTTELISEALHYQQEILKQAPVLDRSDCALLLRWFQLRSGKSLHHNSQLNSYGHIVIDEVQDFKPAELSTLVSSVEKPFQLTLAGDTSQAISPNNPFPGWEQVRRYWSFSNDFSEQITLEISFRSTLPIMRLASFVKKIAPPNKGRNGRRPIWFKCRNEEEGFRYAIHWLETAIEKYPDQMTAVICRDRAEAREVYNLLQPSFNHSIRLGNQGDFSFQEGIVISDVATVKGLEFFNVLVWNVASTSFPAGEMGANLLYVALTRAEENLALISWKHPAASLANCPEHLVRLYDLRESDPLESRQ